MFVEIGLIPAYLGVSRPSRLRSRYRAVQHHSLNRRWQSAFRDITLARPIHFVIWSGMLAAYLLLLPEWLPG